MFIYTPVTYAIPDHTNDPFKLSCKSYSKPKI